MINQKRIFDGGMNADDSLRLLSDREYIQLMNGRVGKSRTGKDYRVENVPGTLQLVSGLLPTGTNMTIGSAVDESRNRLIYFNYNSGGNHGIYAYDLLSSTSYIILLNSQVTGGLNFSLTNRIDRNARVVGDQLYWTDNYNEPRCINTERAIKLNQSGYSTTYTAYASPLLYTDITLIKRPPIYCLTAAKATDSSYANNLTGNSSFQFCYRYIYKDNQVSALSEFSNFIPCNNPLETYNAIDITMPLAEQIDDYIQGIDFIVRFGNNGNSFVIKSLNKNKTADATSITNHNAGTAYTYRFYNDRIGIALDSISANTSFDYVPLKTKTLEIARNRLFLANNIQGYDSPATTSIGLSFTDLSSYTPNTLTATFANAGQQFDQPSTFVVTLGSGTITTTDYVINNQTTPTACSLDDQNTTFPYYSASTDCVFWNTSTTKTFSFSASFMARMFNDNVDSSMSIYAYIVGSNGNTKTLQKVATFLTKKGQRYTNQRANMQVLVPPLTKVFLANYPDYGHTGTLDNNIYLSDGQIYLREITSLSYPSPFFKTGANYKPGVVFRDRFGRKCGVVTQDSAILNIPRRGYNYTPNNTVTWSLSNTNALAEIPSFAYSYQVVMTKPLNNNSYIQGAVYDIRYATKDNLTGLYTYKDLIYSGSHACIGVNIRGLVDVGLGYTYTVGDEIYLYNNLSANGYTLRITGVDSTWVQCELRDIGALGEAPPPFATGSVFLWGCEIYSPISASVTDNYYAVTPVYAVTNPTLSTRSYSTLTGTLQGDTYLSYREKGSTFMLPSECMNPNVVTWQTWDRNLGWLNLIDTIGQKAKTSNIQFSDTFINGTKQNGLNKFEVLNTTDINSDSGSIMKLQLTNKIGQQIGTVLLIISESDTISAYLGETQISASAQNAFVATSNGVIGSLNSMKNNYGTLNPESVFAYMGSIWWYDMQNGAYIQYSDSGNFAISSYKMASFFTKYAADYLALGASAISTINGFSHIPTIYDPFHKELFVTLPALTTSTNLLPSYSGVTPSYASSINNRFDVYDKLGKTLTFNSDKNKWISSYEFLAEWLELVNTDVLMFKNGILYKKESDFTNYNTFFGTQYPTRLVFTPNSNPSEIKDVMNMTVEGQVAPDYAVVYADYPNIQITDLVGNEWTDKEGNKYKEVYRDRMSPNVASSDPFTKSQQGDYIKDVAPKIMLEWQKYNGLLAIDFVNVGCSVSRGHALITKQ